MIIKKWRFIEFCFLLISFYAIQVSCTENKGMKIDQLVHGQVDTVSGMDTTKIPKGKYGEAVRYGRELMMRTAYYIGPNGINGKYLGNKMNCTNCHQNAGTKAYSFNLMNSFRNYPQYRAREGKVLSMAERINNCIMHPHLGKPLPLDSKEMIGFLCYLKWLSDSSAVNGNTPGVKNLSFAFPEEAASPTNGGKLFAADCARCHGANGEGMMMPDSSTYVYPPLWGRLAYQPGSSMHRVIKQAQWLMANMPYDKATHQKPFLTVKEALDLAAFINDDRIHPRPRIDEIGYPNYEEKAIDYDKGSFNDTFPESQHKYGPFQPIIDYRRAKGLSVSF
ncbi:MAG: c-type cytochrome [Bacteroidetes bacterium]|nr:c-type cytochrome [Bacteroidota bacterium]